MIFAYHNYMKKQKLSPITTVSDLITALGKFHPNANIAFTIQEHHWPGETYLIQGLDDGWDSEKTGEYPIDIIPHKKPSCS